MSNACLKTIKFSTALPRTACSQTSAPLSPHNAFFSRFYSVVTAPARPSWRTIKNDQPGPPQRQSRRCFHEGFTCLKRKAPGTKARDSRPAPARKLKGSLGDLSQEELQPIFDSPVTVEVGNSILQTLHYRRLTGSLIEHGLNIEGTDVSWEARERVLAWLREKYPVDEKTTAAEWADRAAEKLQETYISRAERFHLIRRRSEDELRQQKDALPPSATSAFDRIRAKNEEKARQEAQKRKDSGEEQRSNELRLAKIEDQKTREEKRQVALAKRKEDLAMAGRVTNMTAEDVPDALTTSQRLLPSTIFAFLVILVSFFGAEMYTPPEQGTRIWQDLPPSIATATAILATCVTITCCWYLPPLQRTLNKYMLVSPAWPFSLSMLGNTFSHQRFSHLGANMLGLAFFGVSLHESIGRGNFLAIYCVGGVVGSVVSLYSSVLRGVFHRTHFGASGCVWAIMMAWAILRYSSSAEHKDDTVWQMTLDMSRYAVIALQVIAHLTPRISETVDVAAHIGGAFVGIIGAWLLQTRAEKSEEEAEVQAVVQK